MFRIAAASVAPPRTFAASAASRRALGTATDSSNAGIRAALIRKHDQTYFLPGLAVFGAVWFAVSSVAEGRTPPSERQGLVYWFGKFVLARNPTYHAPAAH
jgi:hypothetical protein